MVKSLFVGFIVLLSACVLEPVPLDGLMCPCANDQWTCVEGRCVRSSLRCGREGAEEGQIDIQNLRTSWVTPNQIRLQWDVADTTNLFAYEVDVAASEDELVAGMGSRLVTFEHNPELARSFLPGSSGADEVDRTTVRRLESDTPYFFRVVAFDEARGVSCTSVVAARTLPTARRSVELFREEHPRTGGSGPTLPACVTLTEGASESYEGDFHYAFKVDCRGGVAVCPCSSDGECGVAGQSCVEGSCAPDMEDPVRYCYENVRAYELGVELSIPSEGAFMNAYYEVAVAIDGSPDAFWSDLGVRTPANAFTSGRNTLVADGDYHVYQVPLSAMGMSYDELMGRILEFRVGSDWLQGATVRLDEVYIRW